MDANTIIDRLGGTAATANLVRLTSGAVSQWRRNGIPKPWLRFFREAHPELFQGQPEAEKASED